MDVSKVLCRVAGEGDLYAAQALLTARYAALGYGEHLIPTGDTYTTFVAELNGEIVATVTLAVDGGAAWLVGLASAARSTGVLASLFELAFATGRR